MQRQTLAEREKPLLAREQEVQNQLRSVEGIKAQIEEAEARMKKSQGELTADEVKNIKTLAKIWSQMEAAEAAKMAASVDPELAPRPRHRGDARGDQAPSATARGRR